MSLKNIPIYISCLDKDQVCSLLKEIKLELRRLKTIRNAANALLSKIK